jgi:osmotically inducible lipoprotein OsmB
MQKRIKRVLSRARYAAIGGAIGAGIGGLVGRNAASTGGALGAIVGATIGEKRVTVDSFIDDVKEKRAERDELAAEE